MAGSRALTQFKKLTLDSLQLGDEFVSDDHRVIPEDIEAHGFAVEDDHPWLAEQLAPPTLMANQALHLRHSKYIVHAGLHARMEFTFVEPIKLGMRVRTRGSFARAGTMSMAFIKPVYAGDRLTVHGIVKDKQPDSGATRVVVEVWVENQNGEKTAVGHASGLVS